MRFGSIFNNKTLSDKLGLMCFSLLMIEEFSSGVNGAMRRYVVGILNHEGRGILRILGLVYLPLQRRVSVNIFYKKIINRTYTRASNIHPLLLS